MSQHLQMHTVNWKGSKCLKKKTNPKLMWTDLQKLEDKNNRNTKNLPNI